MNGNTSRVIEGVEHLFIVDEPAHFLTDGTCLRCSLVCLTRSLQETQYLCLGAERLLDQWPHSHAACPFFCSLETLAGAGIVARSKGNLPFHEGQ
jgi:hypothetical protein